MVYLTSEVNFLVFCFLYMPPLHVLSKGILCVENVVAFLCKDRKIHELFCIYGWMRATLRSTAGCYLLLCNYESIQWVFAIVKKLKYYKIYMVGSVVAQPGMLLSLLLLVLLHYFSLFFHCRFFQTLMRQNLGFFNSKFTIRYQSRQQVEDI